MNNEQLRIISEVEGYIESLIKRVGTRAWFGRRADFVEKLYSKYGAAESGKYFLYHTMLGGGGPGETDLFDFPEPDSIYGWLKSQMNPTE